MKKNLCLFFALFASLSAFSQDSKVIESIFKTQYELSIENVAKNLEKNGFTLLSHPALAELSYSARDGSYFAMYSKNDTVDVIVILYPFSGKIGFQKSRNSAEIFYIKSSYSNTYKIHWIYNRPCGINTLVDTYDAYIHLITKGVSATKIEEIAPGLTSIYTTEGNFEVNALDGNVHISYEQARQGIENEPNPEDDYEFITNEFKIVNGRISDKEIYGAFIDWYSSLEYHFYEIANWQVSKVRFNGNKQIYAITVNADGDKFVLVGDFSKGFLTDKDIKEIHEGNGLKAPTDTTFGKLFPEALQRALSAFNENELQDEE